MTELKLLLVDDEPLALERLQLLLAKIPHVAVVGTARNGIEASEFMASHPVDVVIVDIEMPRMGGIAFADACRGGPAQIVFVTAFDKYAVTAFDLQASDYLLKPVQKPRLEAALERVREMQGVHRRSPQDADDAFWVKERREMVRVGFADILWIEAEKDYVLLHTASRKHIMRATMAGIEKLLAARDFLRVHRSAIVNVALIRAVRVQHSRAVVIQVGSDAFVPVGQSYLQAVADRFPDVRANGRTQEKAAR